jgi:hypothetical protein
VRDLRLFPKGKNDSHTQSSRAKREISSIILFGWSWRRGLIPPPFIVVLSEAKDLPTLGREKDPFPTDRILVVLSTARDLRLISLKGLFYCVIPRASARGISYFESRE